MFTFPDNPVKSPGLLPDKEESVTDLVTVSRNDVDDKTPGIRTGNKVENDGEHAETGEERTHISERVHQRKPHVIYDKTRQPGRV